MAKAVEQEEFSGASLDVIEIPDDDIETLKGFGQEQEEQKEEEQEQKAEQEPKPRERKKSDYQERINKLVREKHEAEEAAAAALAKAEMLERQMQERSRTEQQSAEQTEAQREQALLAAKKQAREAGDLDAYDEANEALTALRLQRIERKQVKPEPAQEHPQRQERQPAQPHPAAVEWDKRNEWYRKPENVHLSREAYREYEALTRTMALGPALFAELDKRLRERPEFDAVLGETQEDEQVETPKPRVAPPSREDNRPARPKPGQLSDYDKSTMRRYKLDPNDPKHREAYLKYKR